MSDGVKTPLVRLAKRDEMKSSMVWAIRIGSILFAFLLGTIPILMGCGGNNTSEIVRTLQTEDFTGIDGILSVCPYYNKPSQEGLYQHFKATCQSYSTMYLVE